MAKYYFTFMQRQPLLKNKFIVFEGTYQEAREQMVANFGDLWGFQYDEKGWILEDGRTQAQAYMLRELYL